MKLKMFNRKNFTSQMINRGWHFDCVHSIFSLKDYVYDKNNNLCTYRGKYAATLYTIQEIDEYLKDHVHVSGKQHFLDTLSGYVIKYGFKKPYLNGHSEFREHNPNAFTYYAGDKKIIIDLDEVQKDWSIFFDALIEIGKHQAGDIKKDEILNKILTGLK